MIKVPVRGLQPGTEYRLRAITTSTATQAVETSEWKVLRTLDANAAKSHFVVWNDTHLNNPVIQQLHDLTPPADFLLWNGDTCNDWTKEEIMLPALLNPGERDITRGRPLMLVWGNHDVRGKWAYQLPDLVATPGGRPFYAFRSGPIAVICPGQCHLDERHRRCHQSRHQDARSGRQGASPRADQTRLTCFTRWPGNVPRLNPSPMQLLLNEAIYQKVIVELLPQAEKFLWIVTANSASSASAARCARIQLVEMSRHTSA